MPGNKGSKIKRSISPVLSSQNFLTSSVIINRLIYLTSINKDDHIIEIGSGKGHITAALSRKCKKVSAIEIDTALFNCLKEKFTQTSNIRLINMDFMRWNLPNKESYKVFANIPFYMTTAIIRKLTECLNPPAEAWLVVEKAAAKRFMGLPAESIRSLMIKPLFDMEIIYHFKKEDFHPKPSVDTVLLHITKKPQPDIPICQMNTYGRFICTCVNKGRLGTVFTKKQLVRILREANIPPDFTMGEVLYIQWLCLFRYYYKR